LTAAAEEIFGVVKGTIVEYQTEIVRSKEENNRLRKLLDIAVQRVLLQTASSENCAQPNINNIIQREGLPVYKAPQPQGTSSAYERESIGLHIDVRGQNTSKLPQQRSPYQPQGIQRVYRCRELQRHVWV
ncbi:unnamed protein product, partial [Coregonus sp. 'balchen']